MLQIKCRIVNKEETSMKKTYRSPIAKKIDYTYEENVVAKSYPISNYADPWEGGRCTYGDGSCSVMFNVPKKARGWDDCIYQGS